MISEFFHETVLRQETVDAVMPEARTVERLAQRGEPLVVVDCTLGGAGHALCFVESLVRQGFLDSVSLEFFGIDRDPAALAAATARMTAQSHPKVRFTALHQPFGTLDESCLRGASVHALYGDFGVSSPQLDRPERGFSLRSDGPLDMRMNPEFGATAQDILTTSSEAELARIFYDFGEEPRARKLARAIVEDRQKGRVPLNSTLEFASYADRVLAYRGSRTPPATRIFQALRIAVNNELGEIESLLDIVPRLVADYGKSAFISFHSLEDRLVKRYFRSWENALPRPTESRDVAAPIFPHMERATWGKEIPRGGVVPCAAEVQRNSRAHSARLRAFCFGERNGRQ